jgi:hypothetical protein
MLRVAKGLQLLPAITNAVTIRSTHEKNLKLKCFAARNKKTQTLKYECNADNTKQMNVFVQITRVKR